MYLINERTKQKCRKANLNKPLSNNWRWSIKLILASDNMQHARVDTILHMNEYTFIFILFIYFILCLC